MFFFSEKTLLIHIFQLFQISKVFDFLSTESSGRKKQYQEIKFFDTHSTANLLQFDDKKLYSEM